jgi:hypothetical protein
MLAGGGLPCPLKGKRLCGARLAIKVTLPALQDIMA